MRHRQTDIQNYWWKKKIKKREEKKSEEFQNDGNGCSVRVKKGKGRRKKGRYVN